MRLVQTMRLFQTVRPFQAMRLLVTSIAILALYVQIISAAACYAAPLASGGPVPFPLCHDVTAAPDQSAPDRDHDAPAGSQLCPLCAVHGQAALVPPGPMPLRAPVAFEAHPSEPTAFLAGDVVRFAAAPPPRGPPVRA